MAVRLSVVLIAAQALVWAIVAILLTTGSGRRTLDDVTQDQQTLIRLARTSYADQLRADPEAAVRDLRALVATTNPGATVTFRGADGSMAMAGDAAPHDPILKLASVWDDPKSQEVEADGHATLHTAARVTADGQTVGVLAVSIPLDRLRENRAQTLAILVAGAAASLLAAGAPIAVFLIRWSGQVHRITVAADRLAGGDLGHRAGGGTGEMTAVEQRLNALAERLGGRLHRLTAQRNELDAILQSIEGGLIALDHEHRVLRMNPAAKVMLGVEEREVRGMLLEEVARAPALNAFVDRAMGLAEPASAEIELHTGGRRSARITSGPLRDDAGEPSGLIMLLADITHLRRLETMRTDFAANVSHELRTPITNIKGYAHTLLETDLADRETLTHFLDVIARNAERLEALIEDLMALTRLERTTGALEVQAVPVRSIIEAAVSQYDAEAGATGVRLEVEVDEDLACRVNPRLVEQAVANLISNALRYGGARVRVTAGPAALEDAEVVEIGVEDEGPGIEEEHLPRLFERFYRVGTSRSREEGGTGLGLAIVKHVALIHGGTVGVDSEVGRGTRFWIRLPAGTRAEKRTLS